MSSQGTTKKDNFLTDLALAYPTGNLIGTQLAPVKPVVTYADTVFADADDAINLNNDDAEGTPANEVNFQVGTGYSYRTVRRALASVISDKVANSEAAVVKSKIRETKKLLSRLRLKHEKRVADILTSSSLVTQYAALTSTDRWDNASYASNFVTKKIPVAVKAIHDACGCKANTIVIPFEAALYLAQDTGIKDKLIYQYGMEVVQASFQNQAMALVGLPPFISGLKVVVSDARMNNANAGSAASKSNVWGKNCLIGYVPPDVSVEDVFGVVTMEYASLSVYEQVQQDPNGRKVIVDWDYAILQADLTCWYLYQTVIS